MTVNAALSLVALAACAAGSVRADPAFAGTDTERYFLAFLRPDPNRTHIEKAERDRIQAAHMANIQKMAADGVLIAAGPMEDKAPTISGIFVLQAPSLAEAKRIVFRDPTVVEKRNSADVHTWMGPKGIGVAYFQWRKAHPGAEDVMAVHALCLLVRGPAWKDDPQSDGEHAVFIDSLRRVGLLSAAGNTEGDPELFALCVFKSDSVEDAQRIIGQDPAVRSGRLVAEFHHWWTADRVLPW
jgi:uncharacterized protein YciI